VKYESQEEGIFINWKGSWKEINRREREIHRARSKAKCSLEVRIMKCNFKVITVALYHCSGECRQKGERNVLTGI
jgi:hypothetical protein